MINSKEKDLWSFAGVVVLAIILPWTLKLVNNISRSSVGAEGRLSAINVDVSLPLGPMPREWEALAQGADNLKNFSDGVEKEIIAIKPEYIRIDHIFDQFGVVGRNSEGDLTFNWNELDILVKKITDLGAMPFFSLSYMPSVISSGDELAAPKNWKEWSIVVQKTIEHYSGQMGLNNVYYEVWNKPDLFGKWKMGGNKDYRMLYSYAAKGAADATLVKPFKIGGPGTTGLYKDWLDNLFPFILENHLRLDFYSWHRYDLSLDKYAEDVSQVNQWIEKNPFFINVEKIVTEMGPNSEAGKENNNSVGAAFTVATARELMYKINRGFSFAISGNWGIINTPRYEALKYLASLGEMRLSLTGEGSWVRAIAAMNNNKFQVILANYDPKAKHSEAVPVSFLNIPNIGKFKLVTKILDGTSWETPVASAATTAQVTISMPPNTVAMVELLPY